MHRRGVGTDRILAACRTGQSGWACQQAGACGRRYPVSRRPWPHVKMGGSSRGRRSNSSGGQDVEHDGSARDRSTWTPTRTVCPERRARSRTRVGDRGGRSGGRRLRSSAGFAEALVDRDSESAAQVQRRGVPGLSHGPDTPARLRSLRCSQIRVRVNSDANRVEFKISGALELGPVAATRPGPPGAFRPSRRSRAPASGSGQSSAPSRQLEAEIKATIRVPVIKRRHLRRTRRVNGRWLWASR